MLFHHRRGVRSFRRTGHLLVKKARVNREAILPHRSSWKWWVTGLLLLATTINYMDRVTLANASVRITQELGLTDEQYGNLELGFGWAFAAGSLVFGFL